LGGERDAAREMAKDNKEAQLENSVLKARLQAAEVTVNATRERHSRTVQDWTAGQVYTYRDHEFAWADLANQLWAVKASLGIMVSMYSWACLWWGLWWALLSLWAVQVSFVVMCVLLAYTLCRDLYDAIWGSGAGGCFRRFVVWRYLYIQDIDHRHADDRCDNNSLQEIKHAPRYAKFLLRRGMFPGSILDLFVPHKSTFVVVSMELLVQICNPKNLDPFLAPNEARSAFQRSAAHNHSVCIDKNMIIQGSYVYQETVCLAFFHYLLLRSAWKKRDFLPALLRT
jgi:hypothetical protein